MDAPGSDKLSPRVVQAHDDPDNTLWVSTVSLWEMQIKHALGKLDLNIPLAQIVAEQLRGDRFALLDIRAAHVLELDACRSITAIPSIAC